MFQNTVVRLTDSLGQHVPDYFVEFRDEDEGIFGAFFHGNVIHTVHAYCDDSAYRSLYINTSQLHFRIDKTHERPAVSLRAEPLFEGREDDDQGVVVGYRVIGEGGTSPLVLGPDQIRELFHPHRTLLVDLKIKRLIRKGAFLMKSLPEM